MNNLEKVYAYIEEHKQDYLDELFIFLRQRSISTTNDGVTECAELLADIMRQYVMCKYSRHHVIRWYTVILSQIHHCLLSLYTDTMMFSRQIL